VRVPHPTTEFLCSTPHPFLSLPAREARKPRNVKKMACRGHPSSKPLPPGAREAGTDGGKLVASDMRCDVRRLFFLWWGWVFLRDWGSELRNGADIHGDPAQVRCGVAWLRGIYESLCCGMNLFPFPSNFSPCLKYMAVSNSSTKAPDFHFTNREIRYRFFCRQ
jgi:hypothetical protein